MSKLGAAATFDVFQLCLANMRRTRRAVIPKYLVAEVGKMLGQMQEPRVITVHGAIM